MMTKPILPVEMIKRIQATFWNILQKKYARKMKKRINNNDFTIISQNCIGGVVYNMLGMRFDSPTINLYIFQSDFCKFCSDLKYYMNQELHFYTDEKNNQFPYAYLGSEDRRISIQFTHYNSEDEARSAWERRKKRIHWDNLFIVTNDGNGVNEEELSLLDDVNCKRKIVFTSQYRPEIKDSFQLHALEKEPNAVYMQAKRDKWTGYRPWQEEFNVAAWLNGEENFRI